jgi:HSP20 family molecular chaperone IbpA
VKAKMKNGVLSITVGKKEGYESGKKKIAIQ